MKNEDLLISLLSFDSITSNKVIIINILNTEYFQTRTKLFFEEVGVGKRKGKLFFLVLIRIYFR